MADPYVGEIRLFAGNFAPTGWAFCNGQILPIQQNTALFSLLGTNYGGNGQTTFGLPDLQDRVPIHAGSSAGPGLTQRQVGESSGVSTVTLIAAELPLHSHPGASAPLTTDRPSGGVPAAGGRYVAGSGATANQPHQNRPPYLGLTYIIALVGVFPPRA
jgi:microcystin-dependent protein